MVPHALASAAFIRLPGNDGPPVQEAPRNRNKRGMLLVVSAKKKPDWKWEAKEVILDQEDLAQLEFSRLLGMSREMSIAKVVAKKLNPSATHLELEKVIRQKGAKAFLNMISDKLKMPLEGQSSTPVVPKKQEDRPVMKQKLKPRIDPVPLAPKPGSAAMDLGWPQVSQDRSRKLLDEREPVKADTRKHRPSAVPLSPRPSAFSIALSPSDLSNDKLWELVGETTPRPKPPSKAVQIKSAPPLQARPSRGTSEPDKPETKAPKKNLAVPSLKLKPVLQSQKEPEETPKEPEESVDKSIPILNKPTAFRNNVSNPPEATEEAGDRELLIEEPLKGPPTLSEEPKSEAPPPNVLKPKIPLPALNRPVTIVSGNSNQGTVTNDAQAGKELPLPVLNIPSPPPGKTSVQEEVPNDAHATKELLPLPVLNLPSPPAGQTFVLEDREAENKAEPEVPIRPIAAPTSGTGSMSSNVVDRPVALPALTKPPAKADTEDSSSSPDPVTGGESDQAVSTTELRRRPVLYVPAEIRPKPQYFPKAAEQEEIDKAWARAEIALDTKEIQEVLFVGSNSGGMLARFGNISGFIPGKELCESRAVKTFRSWAREKGHDVGHASILDSTENSDEGGEVPPLHPACEADLHEAFSQERAAVLSSFVGQKANVVVTYIDRPRRKLIFSEKRAVIDNSGAARRKKELIEELTVGDVVTGKVRNISLFGVFVDLDKDVSGLVQFSELSWTPVSDPATLVHVGQELQVKVTKLDRDRQRIFLSLKRMTPDPLLETVESMLAKETNETNNSVLSVSSDENPVEPPPSCEELDELIAKLEARQDIQGVSKGQYLHGVAVVPNFQVYLSSGEVSGGYKLLARFGNEVQEVLLRTNVDRETMKSIIVEATAPPDEEQGTVADVL